MEELEFLKTRVKELSRKKFILKEAIDRLGTEGFSDFANQRFPHCCGWKELREQGLLSPKRMQEIGSMVRVFLLEQIDIIEAELGAGQVKQAISPVSTKFGNSDHVSTLKERKENYPMHISTNGLMINPAKTFMERVMDGDVQDLMWINNELAQYSVLMAPPLPIWDFLGLSENEANRLFSGQHPQILRDATILADIIRIRQKRAKRAKAK